MSSNNQSSRNSFHGEYENWQKAERALESAGNERDQSGLENHLRLALKVAGGELAFVRDGVALNHNPNPFALLAVLMRISLQQGGNLRVIDFGGAFGTTFFQTREFLTDLASLRWAVVELPELVSLAQDNLAVPGLSFHNSIKEAHEQICGDVVIFSGVLQYLPEPQSIADQAGSLHIQNVILDRTPIIDRERNRICLQTAHSAAGERSWPIRLFSEKRLLGMFSNHYRSRLKFDSYCDAPHSIDGRSILHKGYWLVHT